MTRVTSSLQDATQAVNAQFLDAIARGDAQALANTYTEDGELLPPGSPEIRGRDAIRAYWQGAIDMGIARAEMTSRELAGVGEDAYEMGQFRLYGANGELLDEGKFIVVWRLEHGEWRWHRDIFNSSRSPQ